MYTTKWNSWLMLALLMLSVATGHAQGWVGTFATAVEYTGKGDMPQTTTLANKSVRQIVKVSLGGSRLQMKLSNEFGNSPVEIKAVYIADAGEGSAIDARTATYLRFGGRRSVTIPGGEAVMSDDISYNLKPLQRLSITVCYGARVPEHATSHRGSRTNSYIADGAVAPKKPFKSIEKLAHWYNLSQINVWSEAHAVAILGNSITDGRGSTTDLQNRWPDFMSEAMGGKTGILNLGIGGNCVVEGGLSQPALQRFDRDILGQQGVDRVIIFEGTNDIGTCKGGYEEKVRKIIDAYQVLMGKARAKGMKVWLATITPTKGNGWFSFFHEAMRQTVNEWIRTESKADGIIDFDLLTRDAADPQKLRREYSDDWLHLNPEGYRVMGQHAASTLLPTEAH